MKIITNPQYNCVLKNCPDCLDEVKKKHLLELYLFLGALVLTGLFYAWKIHQLNQKEKEKNNTMKQQHRGSDFDLPESKDFRIE